MRNVFLEITSRGFNVELQIENLIKLMDSYIGSVYSVAKNILAETASIKVE